jgi:hypothetical protein
LAQAEFDDLRHSRGLFAYGLAMLYLRANLNKGTFNMTTACHFAELIASA